MVLALSPYVFLTYQNHVPSRHMYLASMGLVSLLAIMISRWESKQWALIFVLAYFGYNVFYAFVREQKVFDAYRKGLLRAFLDAAYLVPAFLALVATMVLLGLLNPLIARLPDMAAVAVSYVVLFGSLTWAKIYFYDVLEGGARRPAVKGPAKAKMAKKKS